MTRFGLLKKAGSIIGTQSWTPGDCVRMGGTCHQMKSGWQLEIVLGIPFTEVYNIGYRGTDQGVQMKSSPEDSPPWNGSNSSGFSGLNGRYRAGPPLGGFAIDGNGWYWTSTGSGTTTAWHRRLYQGSDQISRMNNLNTNCGFSVRCLKNSE